MVLSKAITIKKKHNNNSELLRPSVSKRVLLQNLSHENEFDLHENEPEKNTLSYEWFRTKTRFETEAKGNSEEKWPITIRNIQTPSQFKAVFYWDQPFQPQPVWDDTYGWRFSIEHFPDRFQLKRGNSCE